MANDAEWQVASEAPVSGADDQWSVASEKPEPGAGIMGVARDVAGAGEGAATLAESLYGLPAATLAKYGTLLGNLLGVTNADPEAIKQKTADFFIHQPTSDVGKAIVGAASLPSQWAGQGVDAIANAADKYSPGAGDAVHQIATGAGDALTLLPLAGIPKGLATIRENSALADQAAAQAEAKRAALNAPRDAILDEARKNGLVVPPTAVNPTALSTAAESVSGKAATRQAMQAKNSEAINDIIRKDLGMPDDQPLTREALQGNIKAAGKSFGDVANSGTITPNDDYNAKLDRIGQAGPDLEGAFPGIGAQANEKVTQLVQSLRQPQFDAKDALGAFKFLNNAAKDNFTAGFSGDPQALQLARAQRAGADALSDLIQDHLDASGNGALADQWRADRVKIAKNYTALGALKGNDINALNLAAQMRKDKPLSGGFRLVANFADQFPEVAAVPKSGAGVSKLAAVVAGEGLAGAAAGHPGFGAAAIGLTGLPYLTRKYLLSDTGQSALGTPSYDQRLIGLAQKYRDEVGTWPPQSPDRGPAGLLPAPPTVNLGGGATTPNTLRDLGLTPDVQAAAVAHPGAPSEVMRPPNAGLLPAPGQDSYAIRLPNETDVLRRLSAQYGLTPDVEQAAAAHPGRARAAQSPQIRALPAPNQVTIPLDYEPDRLAALAQQYATHLGLTPDVEAAAASHPGVARPATELRPNLNAIERSPPALPGSGQGRAAQQRAIRDALDNQAGFAQGGYASELALMRHWAQHR